MLTTGGMKGYVKQDFLDHCIDVTCGDSTLPDGVIQSNPDHKTYLVRNTKGAQLGWPMDETPGLILRFKEGRRVDYFLFELHFKTKSVYETFKTGEEKALIRYSDRQGPWNCKTIAYDDDRLVIWTQATGPNMNFICFTDAMPSDVETIIFWFYDRTIFNRFNASYLPNPHGLRLKPISVGDKLGLVYWDGDHSIGGNYIDCCNVAGDKAYTLNVDAGYFNYYNNGNYIKLLDKAGTVNLSNLLGATDITVSAIRGTEFQKHLFHVI